MPAPLGRTHPRCGSPYIAGLTRIAILCAIVFGFAIAGLDPLLDLATAMTGFGAVGLMSLLVATSIATAVFSIRRGEIGAATVVAPIVGRSSSGSRPCSRARSHDPERYARMGSTRAE